MKMELEKLVHRWRKDAEQYTKQIQECTDKGVACEMMKGVRNNLKQCADDLETYINKEVTE